MYLGEQRSMMVISSDSNSNEPPISFYIFQSSHHSYHAIVLSSQCNSKFKRITWALRGKGTATFEGMVDTLKLKHTLPALNLAELRPLRNLWIVLLSHTGVWVSPCQMRL